MNSNATSVTLVKGDLVCRPVYWVDIIRFLLFNYVLHAATVLSSPGDRIALQVTNRVVAMFVPLFGTARALAAIYRFARGESKPLEVALRARALCMIKGDVPEGMQDLESTQHLPSDLVIPAESPPRGPDPSPEASEESTRFISLTVTTIQGQQPVKSEGLKLWFRNYRSLNPKTQAQRLVSVPHYYKVAPIIRDIGDCGIGSNYSVVKVVAAIAQIVYGSFQLYQTGDKQIKRFGYAAYQLTIIPYIIMSLINLLASLCEPEFPAMLLVTCVDDVRSEPRTISGDDVGSEPRSISGQIGIVTAARTETLHASRMKKSPKLEVFLLVLCFVLAALALIGPYIIIYLLTHFKLGSDPGPNLTWGPSPGGPFKGPFKVLNPWVVIWIAYGQFSACLGVIEHFVICKVRRGALKGSWVLFGAGVSLYGFRSIIALMKNDDICIVI